MEQPKRNRNLKALESKNRDESMDKKIEELARKARERMMKANSKKQKANGVEIIYEGPYFSIVPDALIRDRSLKAQAKAVYVLLRSYAEKKSSGEDTATPMDERKSVSKDTLAKDIVMSVRHLSRWVKILERAGWISIERRGLNKPNRYKLHWKMKRRNTK